VPAARVCSEANEGRRLDGAPVFLHVDTQRELGPDGYENASQQWKEFFKRELKPFLTDELDPLGRKIIEACMNDATQEEYWKLIPHQMFKS